MKDINKSNLWKNIFTEVEQEKDVEIKSQGKVNLGRINRLRALDPAWKEKMRRRSNDPNYLKKLHNTVFSKEHKLKLSKSQKDKFKDPKIAKIMKDNVWKNNQTRVRVKEPGQPWKEFDSCKEASAYCDYKPLEWNPQTWFPKDGSIRMFKKGKLKGWQVQRIIKE